MPVTKTAKRALRVSKRKRGINQKLSARLEIALRLAKNKGGEKDIVNAISLADRAAKSNIIHENKAARIKSSLSKLLPKKKAAKTKVAKKSSPKKKK